MSCTGYRLDRLLRAQGVSSKAAAQILGCTPAFVAMMRRGEKRPGLAMAVRIERLTAQWSEGPIRPSEWCAVEELAPTSSARPTPSPRPLAISSLPEPT